MITIFTHQGRRIEIILQSELCDPFNMGEYVRAYCHIHGSDHQRSLSINKATGWGHCFNATCDATVLVAEWNPTLAKHLLHLHYQGLSSLSSSSYRPPRKQASFRPQPLFPLPSKSPPRWQQEELSALLDLDRQMQEALVQSWQARKYLEERRIPLEVARTAGICYLPPTLLNQSKLPIKKSILRRWADRILFPLTSLSGKGYIGRSLWRWQPGMDENAHKSLLDRSEAPKRWIKTNPAGWFGPEPEELANCLILVEGAFDRLALLSSGFKATEVVALAGTAAQVEWFQPQVKAVVLALDADDGGTDAALRLTERLEISGIHVRSCPPHRDAWGKDWNERWRRMGPESMLPIFGVYTDMLHSA